jgi:hypothetical protein
MLNKNQQREVANLNQHRAIGNTASVALGLSALIRCAMKATQQAELIALADQWGVANHPLFVVSL